MKSLNILVLIWAGFITNSSIPPSSREPVADDRTDIIYASSTGDFVFAVVRGAAYIGELPDRSYLHQIDRLLPQSLPLSDMSTDAISCVATGHITFAVPKHPTPAERYGCNGLEFRVDSCTSATCASYQVEAICRHFENGACGPGRRGEAPAMEYRFSGSREIGISLINFDPPSRESVLTLRQGRGLLHQPSGGDQ